MKFELRSRDERIGVGRVPLGLVFGGVLVTGAALTAVWFRLRLPVPACVFREWTGLPCPTCGSARLARALLSGDVAGAFAWNPLVFVVLTAVALWAGLTATLLILGLPAPSVVLARRERVGLRILAPAVLAAGWAYLVWRGV